MPSNMKERHYLLCISGGVSNCDYNKPAIDSRLSKMAPLSSGKLIFVIITTTSGMVHPELQQAIPDEPFASKSFVLPPRYESGYRNCREIQQEGKLTSDGVYIIYPHDSSPHRPVAVFCDMATEGGGWTVIQRRESTIGKENFSRTFLEYGLGFGDPERDHWLGLDHVHALTNQGHNQIRIDMTDFYGNETWAEYDFFYVGERDRRYTLEAKYYRGDAGDSLSFHSGKDFQDNMYSASHESLGGWWHGRDRKCNLNGVFWGQSKQCDSGVFWSTGDRCLALNTTAMKIRPNY
ncbi:ficolin-1-A-like [Penaeus monodon]|uniref:ficolin-1-A-like n=1 Tax=Penaeus monodon TaxID=6687 RepID=UPI0018A7AC20|nr:ficolin-1-A-like [Penaeus monodon]